jgi:hypothetical protein
MVRIINWTLWLEAIDAATNQGAGPGGTSGQLVICGLRSSAAAAHGSPDGDRGTARVHPSARLMENFHQHQVEQAVSEALRLSAISFDAVKLLLLARLDNRPARLDLTFYP